MTKQERFALMIFVMILLVGSGWSLVQKSGFRLSKTIQVIENQALIAGVDINTADSRQLQGLPQIGEVVAGRIIEFRRDHGPFTNVRQLLQVRGIGSRTLERLRPYLKEVDP